MHLFSKLVVNPEYLFEKSSLKEYIKRAYKLAGTEEAIEKFETGNYKDYETALSWSPGFFGSSIEFLAECFFKEFGTIFNVSNFKSVDDFESSEADTGVDHFGQTITRKMFKGTTRIAEPGSPVFIQTKGTINPKKEFKTNDGSRLPNFYMNAQAKAVATGHAYQARYILFTTGSGLHFRLDNNSGKITEVINYKKISKLINGNEVFFNHMRCACNIDEVEVSLSELDALARANLEENS